MSRFAWLLVLLLALPAAGAAETLHDPTRPPAGVRAPAAAGSSSVPLEVNFIISASERRLARINGRWVGEGDRVAGAEVLRIEPERVRVGRGGKVFDLPLRDERVRKRPAEPATAET